MIDHSDDLWCLVGAIAVDFHEDRIGCIIEALSELKSCEDFERAKAAFGPNGQKCAESFQRMWRAAPNVTPIEIIAGFRAATKSARLLSSNETVDLVWTGPKTGLIPVRNTEQVTIEVIESAQSELFVVSFVFYKAVLVVEALNAAVKRGVIVNILLEASIEQGGSLSVDGLSAMHNAVPGATMYRWDLSLKSEPRMNLSHAVHAKCVVCDRRLAFITSANLTSAALERNMELGLLIRGGCVPERLHGHLQSLVTLEVLKEWQPKPI